MQKHWIRSTYLYATIYKQHRRSQVLLSISDRIVLAKELSLEQVKEICTQIKKQNITGPNGKLVEIEVFAHGALCVAVSGRCAMSLYCYESILL